MFVKRKRTELQLLVAMTLNSVVNIAFRFCTFIQTLFFSSVSLLHRNTLNLNSLSKYVYLLMKQFNSTYLISIPAASSVVVSYCRKLHCQYGLSVAHSSMIVENTTKICLLLLSMTVSLSDGIEYTYEIDCNNLRMGQYICPHPDYDFIDPATQQPRGCTKENKAKVLCLAADGLICTETKNNTFKKDIPCKWTNGYSFETSLLLSIFLGMFGADRFYLGYPALGLLKLSTLGFLFLGQFADVILIATQIVGPADGSHYVMPYYGAGINIITSNNFTYRVPQYDC